MNNRQVWMARDFGANQSLESAGILCVFQALQTKELRRKIRQPPQTIYSEVNKIKSPCAKTAQGR
jgi:hypothetical protein